MTTYTHENYDQSVLPGTFKKDLVDTIGVAVTLGWKVNVNRKQTVSLISYDGVAGERIGVSNTNRVDVKQLRRKIIRYADPDLKAAAADYIETGELDTPLGKVPVRSVVKQAAKGIVEIDKEAVPDDMVRADAHIVREGPMLARKGKGEAYYSPTTIERKWSDGSTDYKCVDCDETSPERLSISRHFANIHSRGRGRQPGPSSFRAEVPDAKGYRPSKRRIEALAEIIKAMVEGGETDPLTLAETALTWVHEQHGTHLADDAEPMTAEETLARIRQLLDDGTMAESQRQIESLTQRVIEAEARAEEQKAVADRARETLRAFTDLAAELGGEQETG